MTDRPARTPFLTGDAHIDREHRDLLHCVEQFERARREADGHDGAVQALHFLLRHAITHFQSEEERMESLGYPEFVPHRKEHARMLEEVRGLVAQFHEMRVPTDVVGRFLSERILHHLTGGDRRFAEWVQSRTAVKNENGKATP